MKQDALERATGLLRSGQPAAAIRLLGEAIAADPAPPELHFELGTALLHTGQPAAAADAYAEAARRRPGWMAPLANRGIALHQLGRHAEAERDLREALRLRPDTEPVLTELAAVVLAQGRHAEAAELAGHAAALAPARPEPLINLGLALHAQGRLADAEAANRRAIATVASTPAAGAMAVYNLAHVLHDQWRPNEARATFRRAVELDGRYPPAQHALLFNLLYDPDQTEQTLFDAHAAWGAGQVAGADVGAAASPEAAPALPPAAASGSRRLRLGYVSPDFRTHSCAYFLQPLLSAHDRTAVEVFAYSAVDAPDAMTAWFRAHTEHWREIGGRPAEAVAAQIRADGIDVLVDLAGHTRGQPLGVFALKPAPVQVAWLGYPATSGLRPIGHRLTDAIADPPGDADRWHTEQLVRLDGGFLCYGGPADAPEAGTVPATRNGHVTFGSFNHISKINPGVVSAWAAILHGLPDARLVLKGQLLAHDAARSALAAAFTAEGIAAERVELRPWLRRDQAPLAAYRDIDIALDTFPYNGTTTTFEALHMGVPVITLQGSRHAARVGASILTHLGRPEWIAATTDDYVARALHLAADLPALAAARQTLRGALRGSSLGDAAAFARRFEAACRQLADNVAGGGLAGRPGP